MSTPTPAIEAELLLAFARARRCVRNPCAYPGLAARYVPPLLAEYDRLLGQRGSVLALHRARESRSINTLGCEAHDVRKGPEAWLDEPDHDACPDCVVTPITVCAGGCCEDWPCKTAQAMGVTV